MNLQLWQNLLIAVSLVWEMDKKRILFVCKHNRFRSKVAEAFFNKFNKNKEYSASSAGLIPGVYPLDVEQVRIAKEFKINLKGKPKPITTDLLKKIGTMIIVADNVPAKIFKNKYYGWKEYVWRIHDSFNNKANETREIISKIRKRVIRFVENLK